jgi:hypothetical protein
MMRGTAGAALDDVAGAAEAFRLALDHDPKELDNSADPVGLGKPVAWTFLKMGRAAEARERPQTILSRKPEPESWWLLSCAYLQESDRDRACETLARAGTYRADHPMEAGPSPYVGEARCESCLGPFHLSLTDHDLRARREAVATGDGGGPKAVSSSGRIPGASSGNRLRPSNDVMIRHDESGSISSSTPSVKNAPGMGRHLTVQCRFDTL